MDELLEQFVVEGRDLVAQAQRDLATLASSPGHRGALDSVFRALHTLKGSVALFDMAAAGRLLHAAETALDRTRKYGDRLDHNLNAALVAVIDQTDRWIDAVARDGSLGSEAEAIANRAMIALDGCERDATSAPDRSLAEAEAGEWLDDLLAREHEILNAATGAKVAFRYSPDPECFFRGEDPLALSLAVPELRALAVLPADGDWPAGDGLEPFVCHSRIEGVSTAPLDDIRAAFRLVPDQVALVEIGAAAAVADVRGSAAARAIVRVEAARIDALADQFGELIVAINALGSLADRAGGFDRALAAQISRACTGVGRAAGGLRDRLDAVRSVALGPLLQRLPRVVREIAADLDKSVEFSVSGESIEADRQIADALYEPLLHLIRNALDHGIELPADRTAAAKSTTGQITLAITRDGDTLLLAVKDDGAGMDPAKIRNLAVMRGLIAADAAQALPDREALRLVLVPGFSTADSVTSVSGRGVGMDAVQAAVERLRGTIEITSELGKGTKVTLRLPATTFTTRLLTIEVSGARYGIALDQIEEAARIQAGAVKALAQGRVCVLRGRTVPVLDLADLLHLPAPASDTALLIITRVSGERVALRVDAFGERLDTVVRPNAGLLTGLRAVSGSALLGDGSVLLVLDLSALLP